MILGIRPPVSAGVHQCHHSKHNERAEGDQHVPSGAIGVVLELVVRRSSRSRSIDALATCLFFGSTHRTEVKIRAAKEEHQQKREDSVEIPRNRGHKGPKFAFKGTGILKRRTHSCRPGRNRRNDAHRSCRAVDDVGELGATDLVGIRNRTHDGADSEAIEVVVNEDGDPQASRCSQRRTTSADDFRRRLAVGHRTARQADQVNQRTQQRAEDKNIEVHFFGHHRKGRFKRTHDNVGVGAHRIDERTRENAHQK